MNNKVKKTATAKVEKISDKTMAQVSGGVGSVNLTRTQYYALKRGESVTLRDGVEINSLYQFNRLYRQPYYG